MNSSIKFRLLAFLVTTLLLGAAFAPQGHAQSGSEDEFIVLGVDIVGNEHVDEETIRAAITNTRIGQPLDAEAANEDLFNIYMLGYFVDVTAGLQDVAGTRDGVRLIIEVFEFPVITDVQIDSEGVPAGVVREWMETRTGTVLNQNQLETDMETVQANALDRYDVYLRPSFLDLDETTGKLTVELRAARVAQIDIVGNEKTQDHVIEREVTFATGDVLNREQVRRTIQRISMLGFFDDVGAQFFETDDPDELRIVLNLEERKTGLASFGAGYSNMDGFVGYVEVADENFLGRGQRANLRWEFGRHRSAYDVGFHEPYFLGTPTSLGFNLYNRTREWETQGEERTDRQIGGDITVGRPLGDFTRGSLRYKMESWNEKVTGGPESDGSTRSVTISSRTDTTNHPFSPTEGFRSRLAFEQAGGFMGGTTHFNKYEADYSTYFKLGQRDGQALALRGMWGQVVGRGPEDLPSRENFFVGGSDTLRGYDFGEFVGTSMFVVNTEFRFPIIDSIEGAVFADFGHAFQPGESINLRDLKAGYGVGVRFDTPLGIMRIDYGIGDDGGRTYFSLGPAF